MSVGSLRSPTAIVVLALRAGFPRLFFRLFKDRASSFDIPEAQYESGVMTTELRITRIGDDPVLDLNPEICRKLGVKVGDSVWIIEAGDGSMTITAKDPRHEEKLKIVERCMVKYADAFRELAKL